MGDVKSKKEIIIKRVSAFKFEIEVCNFVPNEPEKPQVFIKSPEKLNSEITDKTEAIVPVQRISVIKRAPPATSKRPETPPPLSRLEETKKAELTYDNPDVNNKIVANLSQPECIPEGAIPIRNAITYRIMEILLWKLLGYRRLEICGYPQAPTYVVLWRVVYFSCCEPGARKAAVIPLDRDHDCGGNFTCFMDHVCRFLEICAPTRDLWKRFGWTRLSVEDILSKIYYDELVPFLKSTDLSSYISILNCYADILRLEKWEQQGYTAISWNVENKSCNYPSHSSCPQCSSNSPIQENILWHVPPPKRTDGQLEPDCKGHAPNYFCTQCTLKLKEKDERMASTKGTVPSVPMPESNQIVKKRGRPSFRDKSYIKKSKRVLLWKFIFDLVEDPKTDDYIRWVNRNEGVFQIINSEWLARTWGRNHGNPKMTYEKMARAMRTYYRSKVLQSVPRSYDYPRKLIYRFNPDRIHGLRE